MVHRRHREVAALVGRLGAEVAARLVPAGVPGALNRVDVVVALVRTGRVPGRVEDVELGLRAEEGRVGNAAAAQVVLGLAGDVARVAAVGLTSQRVVHEERQVQRLVRTERVKDRRAGVWKQQHVRFVNLLETADRRAVEHPALGEDALIERLSRHREVLHGAGQVAEAHVDELHPLRLDEPQYLVAACEHQLSLGAAAALTAGAVGAASLVTRRTLSPLSFLAVSLMFRRCYAGPGGRASLRCSIQNAKPGTALTGCPAVADTVGVVTDQHAAVSHEVYPGQQYRAAGIRPRLGGRLEQALRCAGDRLARRAA